MSIYPIARELKACSREQSDTARTFISLIRCVYRSHVQLWLLITLLIIVVATHDLQHDMPVRTAVMTADTTAQEPGSVQTQLSSARATDSLPSNPQYSSGLPFMGVTEFNEKNSRAQASIDMLKQRYEAWLVTYYYLQKCAQTQAQDFTLIEASMRTELSALGADETVQNNILLAATGSYNEMYRDIPCDNRYLTSSKSSYDANMQQLKAAQKP